MPDVWATFGELDAITQQRLAEVLEARRRPAAAGDAAGRWQPLQDPPDSWQPSQTTAPRGNGAF